MMKKVKSVIAVGVVLALAIPLVASACAPAAAPEEVEKKPAEVYTGIFSNRDPVYAPYCEQLTNEIRVMTNGQLDLEVVLEESLGNMEEGVTNLGDGIMQIGRFALPYSSGIAPSLRGGGGANTFNFMLKDEGELLDLEYEYGIGDIFQRMVYDKFDITRVGTCLYTLENLVSTVPLYGLEDLKNVKFRSAGVFAKTLEAFGAKTTWFPGTEIYTSLASGLIDAASYECPSTMYEMGLNEVTKYWTGFPLHRPFGCNYIMANMDWWNNLPEHIQAAAEIAVSNASYRNYIWTRKMDKIALKKVAEEGISVISWNDEDMTEWSRVWYEVNIEELAETDAVIAECMPVVKRFMEDVGRPLSE